MTHRFDTESSVYLRRFAHHAIRWLPWGEEAFRTARRYQRPLFISIGYTGCRWCEKMDQESFADTDTIKTLNDSFVCIKVDAYQRPDIAAYFQLVYETMNKRPGGWPLTVCLSEEGIPFYTGAYLSLESQEGVMSLPQLLTTVQTKYRTDKSRLIDEGKSVLSALKRPKTSIQATRYDTSLIDRIGDHAERLFDFRYGGFGTAPKFPQTSLLQLLLEHYRLTSDTRLRHMLVKTLDAMANGSFHDKNGGFFHAVYDDKWLTPHQAKTLYGNALLSRFYLDAGDTFDTPSYREIALKTLDFILDTMRRDDLFISVIDTQTTSIDTQVVTAWNAMAVAALFVAARVQPKRYLSVAQTSLDTLLNTVEKNRILFHTVNSDNEPTVHAFLDDYAYLGEALIEAYRTTLEERYLITAQRIANAAIERFYDRGFWHYARGDFQTETKPHDLMYPSASATMVHLLQSIATLVDPVYMKFVSQTLAVYSYDIMRRPLETPKLTSAALRQLCGELAIRAKPDRLRSHLRTLMRMPYPYIAPRSATNDGFVLADTNTTLAHTKRFEELVEPIGTYRRRVSV